MQIWWSKRLNLRSSLVSSHLLLCIEKKKKKSCLSEFIDLVFQKVQIDFPAKYLAASFAPNDRR